MEASKEKQLQQIKDSFFSYASEVMKPFPDKTEEFNMLWKLEKYKEAYVLFTDFQLDNNLNQKNKADEDFYWTFMH